MLPSPTAKRRSGCSECWSMNNTASFFVLQMQLSICFGLRLELLADVLGTNYLLMFFPSGTPSSCWLGPTLGVYG
jgi:hypothetical protein